MEVKYIAIAIKLNSPVVLATKYKRIRDPSTELFPTIFTFALISPAPVTQWGRFGMNCLFSNLLPNVLVEPQFILILEKG